ncbi:MAG TPA: CBS domain-containing protein [Pyrinomonadaceae bacterium]|jgi:CBS domain-containing protein|nr:CBS domain-containing protein [Pyrinomonadaceae bacterium]
MKLSEVITKNPACCFDTTSLVDVAKMMADYNCGSIPVVDAHDSRKPIGTITDRDITIRAVAHNKNPLTMLAGEVMTDNPITIGEDATIEEACEAMENAQIRRILVVDKSGACVGIVAQADIAQKAGTRKTAELVKDVSA